MEEHINNYLNYLLYQRNYSNNTILSYKEELLLFLDYLNIEYLDYISITYQDIRPFFEFLSLKKYSKSSTSHIISVIRGFYNYLVNEDIITFNPFSLVSSPKKDIKIPKFLYYNELEELFLTCNLKTSFGVRNRLILELLYATGMRVGELVSIKIKDIDIVNKQIKIMGKGSKERYVYFGDYVLEYLNLYLNGARKELLCGKSSDYLFINNKRGALTERGVRTIIDSLITSSSINSKISPHTLRHTFATHLLNNGCDILSVQELLGHSSLKATQVYTHVTDEKIKEVYLKTHPRNFKKIDKY